MNIKNAITSLILGLTLLTSCSDFDRRTKFMTSYTNRVTFTTNGTSNEIKVGSDTIVQNFMQTVRDHDASERNIESVMMAGVSLEIDRKLSPEFANFDFLKGVKVYLKAKGHEEVLIANVRVVPEGGYGYFETHVIPKGRDFQELLLSNEFTCRLEFTTDSDFVSGTVVKIITTYHVDTKRFGV